MKDWYRFFSSFIKDNTHLEKVKVFKEIPTITINYKAKPKIEIINFTLNLKCKNFLENE